MSSDKEECSLADKLRKENEDQFFILVRMHLSFVLDINTDEVDTSEKSKYFKWNFTKRNLKAISHGASQNSVITSTRARSECSLIITGIDRINEIMDFLGEAENICQEGIFRRTGSLSRQQELKQLISSNVMLNLSEGKFSVHDCASVLKGFLADLPEPLLQEQHYQAYCHLSALCRKGGDGSAERVLTGVQLLVLQLSNQARTFLMRILSLLSSAAKTPSSRMSAETLATLFTPHLLCPRRLSPEALHTDSSSLAPVLSFMISHSEHVFETPAKLAADIAAYFTVRERRRMLSPNGELDESVSDRTAANTIFTFVDRDRTAVENESNPTDTALAQLYAHIQSLPDSQHKRRLVKQFNRENGYGTPRQLQRHQKLKPKTLGDSIKKHIFHKSLLNKHTPKKYQELQNGSGISESPPILEDNKGKMSVNSRLHFTQMNLKTPSSEVSHRNIILKSLANQMSQNQVNRSDESSDSEADSESSDGSVHSESGKLDPTVKLSPKFSSEPNLSTIDCNDVTKTTTKKTGTRLFRSKIVLNERKPNVQQKKPIRLTPKIKTQDGSAKTCQDYSPLNIYKTCVKCTDDVDSCSEVDESFMVDGKTSDVSQLSADYNHATPRLSRKDMRSKKVMQLMISNDLPTSSGITSTPNLNTIISKLQSVSNTPIGTTIQEVENYSTPYYAPSIRRSSMSPITKSTQKMTKAMQESIMTPRSRKPVVVLSTCDQSGVSLLYPDSAGKDENQSSYDSSYDSFSQKNDSDFVSTDESNTESNKDNASLQALQTSDDNKKTNDVPYIKFTDSCSDKSSKCLLKNNFKYKSMVDPTHSDVGLPEVKTPTLSEPFRKYLLSRSVLTATPVDLSFTSFPEDTGESYVNSIGNLSEHKMTDSLLFCLNGNNPLNSSYSKNQDYQKSSEKEIKEVLEANTKLRDITNILPHKTTSKDDSVEENNSEGLETLKVPNKSPLGKRSSRRISCNENDFKESEVKNKKATTQDNSSALMKIQPQHCLRSTNETDL